MVEEAYRRATDLLKRSHRAVALTGAGISTPSGLADFRSPGTGLWSQVDPMEVASLQAFQRDPLRFYNWFVEEALAIFAAEPNPAHYALVELEQAGTLRTVVTQNIDRLHQKAGSRYVLELHGNCQTATCMRCGAKVEGQALLQRFIRDRQVPHCACGGLLKPDVIFFGELLPRDTLEKAWEEIAECDLLVVIGSSLTVAPASELPWLALRAGTPLIICNLTTTWADRYASVVLQEDVSHSLPKMLGRF